MARFLKNEIEVMKAKALEILAKEVETLKGKSQEVTAVDRVEEHLAKMYFSDGTSGGNNLAAILSEIMGTKVNFRGNGSGGGRTGEVPVPGTIIVPLGKNGHNYSVGKPIMYIGVRGGCTYAAMKVDGSLGNNLQMGNHGDKGNSWRYATAEEIEKFFKAIEPPDETVTPTADDILRSI